ncbi:MAG TPA: hypothetical protein VF323_12480 [Candidatus Limnocylindrales bacterium]
MPPRDILAIVWSARDPDAVATRLRGLGFALGADRRMAFPSAVVRIQAGTVGDDRLGLAEGPAAPPARALRHANGIADVVAVGWATVDRERFVADSRTPPVEALPNDPHLGAFVVRQGTGRPYALVVEPDTEGRLAASLVRFGEGPAALYLSCGAGGLAAFVGDAGRRGSAVSSVREGPLGPAVVLLGGPAWGPHILVVEADPPP